jgi:hypothetical protein
MYQIPCQNCKGHGTIAHFKHVENGICFECSGSGIQQVNEKEYNECYTVVCSQRPLNGIKTWEHETIGNGRYYAYGNMEQYENVWNYLDAAIINLTTNKDIESIIKNECIKEGIDIDELLQENTMSELAGQFELCYIN